MPVTLTEPRSCATLPGLSRTVNVCTRKTSEAMHQLSAHCGPFAASDNRFRHYNTPRQTCFKKLRKDAAQADVPKSC